VTDPTPIEKAEEAVCDAIAKKANAPGKVTDLPTAEGLKSLAEGVAAMKHGPQGGSYTYDGRYVSSTQTDAHTTDHEGEARSRPTPGFTG
jgi:hypothetical protein